MPICVLQLLSLAWPYLVAHTCLYDTTAKRPHQSPHVCLTACAHDICVCNTPAVCYVCTCACQPAGRCPCCTTWTSPPCIKALSGAAQPSLMCVAVPADVQGGGAPAAPHRGGNATGACVGKHVCLSATSGAFQQALICSDVSADLQGKPLQLFCCSCPMCAHAPANLQGGVPPAAPHRGGNTTGASVRQHVCLSATSGPFRQPLMCSVVSADLQGGGTPPVPPGRRRHLPQHHSALDFTQSCLKALDGAGHLSLMCAHAPADLQGGGAPTVPL